MKLEMRGQMNLEQQMKLAPHMIQSMEILQLPILALQERIEQELNSNPVLEAETTSGGEDVEVDEERIGTTAVSEEEKRESAGQFERLDDNFRDYIDQDTRPSSQSDEPDKKLEAIKNTAAPAVSLNEYLNEQWHLVEANPRIKAAGSAIIDYLDDRGYLSVRLEQLHNKDKKEFDFDDLQKALELVQKLEPAGVGARDIKECLLIQMEQSGEYSDFEFRLIKDFMDELLGNHLPVIAKKMNCTMEKINQAIKHIGKLDTSPGLQISPQQNPSITADVIVEPSDDSVGYSVRLADANLPNLRINNYYANMAKDTNTNEKTKQFLRNNITSAQWIIDAIEQRKNTLLKVSKSIVRNQKDFFDNGTLYLKPLPMSKVAEEVGVHLATVSRAVAGKYVQCSWGILPLRKFFSGGTEDTSGDAHSWEAVRAKLQQIIDDEDKTKPLTDEQLRKKLADEGITDLARRTVVKYRKLLKIPVARLRKKY